MSKNPAQPKPSEPGLFVNFDPPKFTTWTHIATAVEQPDMGNEIGKFLQSEQQPTLHDIECQLTPRQKVSKKTQTIMAKVLKAITGIHISVINFYIG
ncbi:MAG: hypothetical protein EZS28_017086 [Streblomastix strix]|uniref:Uncharacterized protein n=1 Tax=Streblomastix strix TaxID=222440 RepID=A0A5J4VXT9_9EUKA|nr:MAG: hypothetical protein EZS28_017086 [Streblomastix strix]